MALKDHMLERLQAGRVGLIATDDITARAFSSINALRDDEATMRSDLRQM